MEDNVTDEDKIKIDGKKMRKTLVMKKIITLLQKTFMMMTMTKVIKMTKMKK